MRVHVLGSGTSQGVPIIGCTCDVCISPDPKDKRWRTSVLVVKDGYHLLIDITPDFRQQMLRLGADRVDALLVTHEHQDHVSGLDDIRPINFKWRKDIPLYTLSRVLGELERRFYYIFGADYPGKPRVEPVAVSFGDELQLEPFHVKTVRVDHGVLPILGFVIDHRLAYLTDCKELPEDTWEAIRDCEVVIMSALRRRHHHAHQDLDEALRKAKRMGHQDVYFTHMCHEMGRHADVEKELPKGVSLLFDGMVLDI